jgi:glycolate oxidase FAD binding subunit
MPGASHSTSRPVADAIPWQELETMASSDELRRGGSADAVCGIVPVRVASPANEQAISALLGWANRNRASVTVMGGGTKQEWGGKPEAIDLLISTAKLSSVIEHAHQDMTATVEAGLTVAQFQAELARHRQRLALDVLWPERSTIGGIIATNDSGALRLRFGSIRDLLIGATVVLADGTIARSGGRVVKNVAGYDLPKLFTGSLGTLGIITQVTFRVHPVPHNVKTLSFRFADDKSANQFILAVNGSSLVPASAQLRCGSDQSTEADVLFEGLEAGIAAQTARLLQMAPAAEPIDRAQSPWSARQGLRASEPSEFIGKVGVLPSAISALVNELRSRCQVFRLVMQATGLAHYAAKCTPDQILVLRTLIKAMGGNLVVDRCPPDLRVDRFGLAGDVIPLMARIKHRFDPNGTLNRGRFTGGA